MISAPSLQFFWFLLIHFWLCISPVKLDGKICEFVIRKYLFILRLSNSYDVGSSFPSNYLEMKKINFAYHNGLISLSV